MRRTAFLAGAPLLAGACARAREAPRRMSERKTPVWLAVLGDSLSFGTGAGDTANGFAFRVYRAVELERPGSEISNFSIGGSTAADVLRLQTARLGERRFDLVIVCAGGNDVVHGTA
ncbi:MAG: SGNH/GDSL hydrolase family protein, partial [Candidatus Velthaea sp.]